MSDICRTFVLVVFAMLNRIVRSASHLVIPYRLRVLPTERLELGHSLSALDADRPFRSCLYKRNVTAKW